MMMAAAKKMPRLTSDEAQHRAEAAGHGVMALAAFHGGGAFDHVAEDILHHDDAGIDHEAEVERADRQQVRTLALQHQDQDGESQREGMVAATMIAERRLPRNSHCSAKIRRMPTTMFSMTVWMVRLIRSERS